MPTTRDVAAALAVSVAAFAVYVATLCPTIYAGDSGELAVAATTLGIAHPPGYPLWTLLGRLATMVLPGTPAVSLNLFSAICAAGAAGILALVLTMLTERRLASAGVALAFAFARAVWVNAVVVEVYALNLLLTLAALAAALAARRGSARLFLLAAYLLGLGAANHPFALLAGPFVVALALAPAARAPESSDARIRRLLPMGALFLLGASVYLYLPVRWAAGPAMNWGGIRNLAEIWDHVTRSQYGGLGEAGADTTYALRLRVFAAVLAKSAPGLALAAAAFGLLSLLRSHRTKRAALLAGLFLLARPAVAAVIRYEDTALDRSVVSVYFLTAVAAAFLLAGTGVAALEESVMRRFASRPALARVAAAAIAALLPATVFARNLALCDRSKSTMAKTYAQAAIGSLPEGSRFYGMGDNECFIIYYFHVVEGLRPDILFCDRTLNLVVESYGPDFPALSRHERKALSLAREAELAFAERDRAVFYSDRAEVDEFGGCRIEPNGVVFQLLRPGESPADVAWGNIVPPPTDPDDYLETILVSTSLYRQGETLLRLGRHDEARASFDAATARAGGVAALHRNLGLAYLDLGDMDAAEARFLRAIELDPDNEDALYNTAIFYAMRDRVEDSLHYFEPLVRAGSEYPEVYLNYGIQLVRAGRLEDALPQAARALAIAPDLQPARDLETAVREGLAIGGEAGILEAQRRVEPVTVGGTLQLAQRYLDRGDVERATELYREALQKAPTDLEASYGLGYGLLKIGRLDEAARAFRTVLEQEPSSADGRNALAFVFAERGESLAVAERLAREAIEIAPSLSAYWNDTLGWVRYRAGRHREALETLRLAERDLPLDDPGMRAENQFHLGSVLAALGRDDEARVAIERSLSRSTGERWEADAQALSRKLGVPVKEKPIS
jgi:tetratricopeptide (TPR) repeat protein